MIAMLAIAIVLPLSAAGQNYDVNDTVTEYPMKGTYYHNKFEGRKTACGEIFDQNLFTAAHWKIKMGTYVMVTNRNTGLQVIVKINDRCPKHGVIDMTHRAANAIGIKGCQPVTVRILPPGYEDICTAQDAKFDSVSSRFATGRYALGKTVEKPSPSTAKKKGNSVSASALPPIGGNSGASAQGERYNLILGTVQSHGEAFEMIQKLPEPYQEKARVDSTDSETFTLVLEVNLEKNKAQELNRALKHTFQSCQITPSK
jgi:rare lipoprotein A